MPYSLLTAATLGFDLVRRPGGQLVAQVLLAALTADETLLTELTQAHPGGTASWASYVIASRRGREAAAQRCRPLPVAAGGQSTMGAWKLRLERQPIGSVEALERLLRQDILGPEGPPSTVRNARDAATEVLVNAMLGAWALHQLPTDVYAAVVGPYLRAVSTTGRPLPNLGPANDKLVVLLASPVRRGRVINHRWASIARRGTAHGWAQAMHRACWATHLSGRTRTVAAAQLLGVQSFGQGRLGPPEVSGNLWNRFAGSIQATAVADLLDEESTEMLVGGWAYLAH